MASFPQTSSLSRSLVGTLPFVPARKRVIPAAVRQPVAITRPIGETLFLDALARERARADRFEEPFVVARVTREEHRLFVADWDRTVTALSTVAFAGDLIGWFEAGTVMGVIRPAASSPSDRDGELEAAAAMRRELEQCLATGTVNCSVTVDVYDPTQDILPEWLRAERSRQ